MNQAYYKKNIDYAMFEEESDLEFDGKFKEKKFEKINNKTFNKYFWHIYGFKKWAEKANTIDVLREDGTNGKFSSSDSDKISFSQFNPMPYRGPNVSLDIMPIFDISEFLCYAYGTKPKENYIEKLHKIKNNLKTYTGNKGRLSNYIDKNFSNMGSASSGLYFNILNIITSNPDEYQSNEKRSAIKSKLNQVFLYFDNKKCNLYIKMQKLIETIPDKIEDEVYRERQILIEEVANEIIVFMQSILSYTQDLLNILDENDTADLNFIQTPGGSDVTDIESIIMMAKPPIKPLFKKSYIMRENNLKAYISVKMLFFPKKEKGKSITIDNFKIPYNNILSIEHSVKDHTITLNMIDTEGIIGEMLVQKMYSVSQNKANTGHDGTADAASPYYFVIEYGWAGPASEDEDELLEEGVFTKTATRGYIKSISSQFSPKGNEYTLTIEPNDKENLSKFLNNHEMLYISDKEELSITVGLMALFLVIWAGDIPELITNFQELFEVIEDASIAKTSSNNYYIKELSKEDSFEIKKNKEIDTIITKLWGDGETSGAPHKKLKDITFSGQNKLENLKKACEADDLVINGWLASIYVIWKMKRIFKKPDVFRIIDTTGVFNVFTSEGNISINSGINGRLGKVLNKFNPFGLENGEKNKFKKILEKTSEGLKAKKAVNCEYQLSNIIDVNPGDEKDAKLTFLANQISVLFSSVNRLGKNFNDANDRAMICQASGGINANLSVFKMTFNNSKDIISEYKKRLFADKFNLIYGENYNKKEDEQIVDEIVEKELKLENLGSGDTVYMLYLSYNINPQNISSLNCSLSRKIYLFSKTLSQSYSFMPRIKPKTRNGNRQFFSQGNEQIFREGSGDIIEFNIDPIDIGTFNSLMLSNKNKSNFISNEIVSNTNVAGIYENAAKFTRNYRDMDGNINRHSIARDLARLDLNYQTQTNLKGSITIIGEPYWSNINIIMKSIFITVYYANGERSSHTGLYYVSNAIQSVSDGKFTTRLEIIRAPTFLSGMSQIGKKNTVLG